MFVPTWYKLTFCDSWKFFSYLGVCNFKKYVTTSLALPSVYLSVKVWFVDFSLVSCFCNHNYDINVLLSFNEVYKINITLAMNYLAGLCVRKLTIQFYCYGKRKK